MEQKDTKTSNFFPPDVGRGVEEGDMSDRIIDDILRTIIKAGNSKLYAGVLYRLYELDAAEEKDTEAAAPSPGSHHG